MASSEKESTRVVGREQMSMTSCIHLRQSVHQLSLGHLFSICLSVFTLCVYAYKQLLGHYIYMQILRIASNLNLNHYLATTLSFLLTLNEVFILHLIMQTCF